MDQEDNNKMLYIYTRGSLNETYKKMDVQRTLYLSSQSRHKKGNLSNAPFSTELNGAFIAQDNSRTIAINELD